MVLPHWMKPVDIKRPPFAVKGHAGIHPEWYVYVYLVGHKKALAHVDAVHKRVALSKDQCSAFVSQVIFLIRFEF